MTSGPANAPDPLADLLDQAHAALRIAAYDRLDGLTRQIEAELSLLVERRDRAALDRVRHRAMRNEACLLAAQHGIRAARRRIEEIRRAQSGLVTYGPTGSRAEPHRRSLLAKRF